jgi:hypothetical protein
VWAAGGRLYAQRDTASATGEELFGFTPDTLERSRGFNALHGGKRIMLYTQQPQALRRGREWSPSGWTLIPFAPSSSGLANASFLSGKGLSHEGDTLVFLQQTVSAPTVTYRPAFEVGSTTTPFTAVITDSAYAGPPVCVATFVEVPAAQHDAWSGDPAYQSWMQQYGMPGACVSEGEPEVKVETSRHLAYAPVGQQAYAFINRTRTTTQVTDGRLCTRAQGLPTYVGAVFFYKANCLSSLSVATTAGMTGYRLDVPRRRIHAVSWRDSTAAFWYPQIDETGRELLVERVTQRSEVRWYWQDDINGTAQYTQAPATSTEGCSLQFRDLATGAVRLAPGICGATGAGGYSAVRTRS